MKQSIILESGKEYSLSQLFSGDNKIVIPDLQRDYCWGNNAWNKEKTGKIDMVSGFIENLLSSYKDKPNDNLTLGLIYGYENPKHHIQLSDGQQRITTLFLLLGMLNRRVENKFQEHLISDYELEHDDKEPYLQYAIRESTLYFLGDLVNEFFIKTYIKKVDDINKENDIKQDWYFTEYDLDSSIQSMISALKTIEHLLDEREENFSYKKFGDFVLENIKMIYYDMGNRTRGEETFVIINTTGEPLTATENLKPILIGNIEDENKRNKASIEWEDREEWFWQNKNKEEGTSDNAMNDFFIWYWQIRLLQEKSWKNKNESPLNPRELFLNKPKIHQENEENPQIERWEKSIKPVTIHSYFNALVNLIKLCKTEKNEKVLNSIRDEDISLNWFRKADLNVVLPLITYLEKFEEPKYFYEFLRRIRKNYFDNKWEERKTNFVDWRYIIQIIEYSANEEDVLKYETNNNTKIDTIKNIALNKWFNIEEKIKSKLKDEHKDKIEEWEDHEDFMGDLSFLFSVDRLNNETPTIDRLEYYYKNYISTINLVKNKYGDSESETDNQKIKIVNLFRLFYLFIGCNNVGHIKRTKGFEGVLFSTINREHLKKDEMVMLCASEDVNKFMLKFIKEKIQERNLFDINEDNFSVDKFIKAWLTLKVFYANDKNILLSFHDENGVAAYYDKDRNKLFLNFEFSIENSICGFGVKSSFGKESYVRYTNEKLWNKPNIIDTTFAGIKFQDFTSDDKKGTQEELDYNKKLIEEIIKEIEIK
ncbi:MAG: DUF262 domain-containing protein [Bacteroidota bacterium]|nr:DUF262 domain-containing protein [Bacteroidota bacterium]